MGDMRKKLYRLYLTYLRLTAIVQLWKIRPKHIVGITGSAGKSSCKDAIYAILKEKYKVKSSQKSLNSEVGIPLDILGFNLSYSTTAEMVIKSLFFALWSLLTNWDKFEIYIAEMGVDSPDEPGNMVSLLKIIHPDIGVFLNSLPVHTAYYSQVSENELIGAIAENKGKLIESLPEGGFAVLNSDEKLIETLGKRTKAKVMTFGKKATAEVKNFLIDLPGFLLTEDYGYSLAAAAAVGKVLGVALIDSRNNLIKNYHLPPGRMSLLRGINGSLIIDSSYNASPKTVMEALKTLRILRPNDSRLGLNFRIKRKIAVIGDMRELGKISQKEHQLVAQEALGAANQIYSFGPLTEEFFPRHSKIEKFQKIKELIAKVRKEIRKGDLILVKGSQNAILLESLVERLLENPTDAEKLCRRGQFWDKKRRELLQDGTA